MKCRQCGKLIKDGSAFCRYCGAKLTNNANLPMTSSPSKNKGGIKCIKCGSTDLQVIADVKGQGASGENMCLGSSLCTISSLPTCLCCGPCCTPFASILGALFGMDGAGEVRTEHLWVCKNCGTKFRVKKRK